MNDSSKSGDGMLPSIEQALDEFFENNPENDTNGDTQAILLDYSKKLELIEERLKKIKPELVAGMHAPDTEGKTYFSRDDYGNYFRVFPQGEVFVDIDRNECDQAMVWYQRDPVIIENGEVAIDTEGDKLSQAEAATALTEVENAQKARQEYQEKLQEEHHRLEKEKAEICGARIEAERKAAREAERAKKQHLMTIMELQKIADKTSGEGRFAKTLAAVAARAQSDRAKTKEASDKITELLDEVASLRNEAETMKRQIRGLMIENKSCQELTKKREDLILDLKQQIDQLLNE